MDRKEALIQIAQSQGIDTGIARAALEGLDREAIHTLLSQMELIPHNQHLIPHCAEEILRTAREQNKVLEIADLLLEKHNHSLSLLADELGKHRGDNNAIAFLRRIITLDWANTASRHATASAMIKASYLSNDEAALHDPLEVVRLVAVKELEHRHNTPALIRALGNDLLSVRQVAAWYMGRNKVYEAVEALLKMISVEQDIEALRAAIWSLGVLRIKTTRSQLEPFLQHENALIRKTAQNTLAKFA
jgi:HEAT repeat protein